MSMRTPLLMLVLEAVLMLPVTLLSLILTHQSVTLADPTVADSTSATRTDTNDDGSTTSASFEAPVPEDDSLLNFVNVAGADLGIPQVLEPGHEEAIRDLIEAGRNYLEDWVKRDPFYEQVVDLCENKHEYCGLWAVLGECQNNPSYMRQHCAVLCQSCQDLHMETRCPIDTTQDAKIAWEPGDLDKMFERITTDPTIQDLYQPTILQRPSYANGDSENTAPYDLGFWVVTLDNVLTSEETDHIIQLGHEIGYNRSADVGQQNEDGTFAKDYNEGRTSETAWCKGPCYDDPIIQRVHQKLFNITRIHNDHAEYLQILKYEPKQFYQSHIDYIPAQKSRVMGVRILTLFLYLSDVEKGGGTNFPQIDITVMPKRGKALLWPSVYNDAPNSMDRRTEHQALPVVRGVKYGANAWYHMRDFKTPYTRGCG